MTTPSPWLAPYRTNPVDGQVLIPGSKSLTNRALVLASLADSPSILEGPLASRDTDLMVAALSALGARVEREGVRWTIIPRSNVPTADIDIDCGLAGTVMRFVPPLATLAPIGVVFDGDPHARKRPMSTIISALRCLGADIDDEGRETLPFVVHGDAALKGGTVEIDASASSQFVSALLLAGAGYDEGVDVHHVGDDIPSAPHIAMTVAQLRMRGVQVDDNEANRWIVKPGTVSAMDQRIEPDLSNAGPFIAGAIVTGGSARIRHWPTATDQAGDQWQTIARSFGATVERDGADLVFAAGSAINAVDLDLHDVGELTPVIAAIAAFADGPSQLTGIKHLRGHETDRLRALATEFNKRGGKVTESDDGLLIEPAKLSGGTFNTYDDHRMAHAGVVIGLRVRDLVVENVATTNKTYPDFAPVWERFFR